MRRTKIICTLGPASETCEIIEKMILAGTDAFRLNMSHAKHDWVRDIVPRVRAIARELDRKVGLLLDTQGPAIRTGPLERDLDLAIGDVLEITVRGAQSTQPNSITVNYDDLIDDVSVGNVVLLDNGLMHVRVLAKEDNRIRTVVLTAGTLGSRRHINLAGRRCESSAVDRRRIWPTSALGCELGVDFVALSFARKRGHRRSCARSCKKGEPGGGSWRKSRSQAPSPRSTK